LIEGENPYYICEWDYTVVGENNTNYSEIMELIGPLYSRGLEFTVMSDGTASVSGIGYSSGALCANVDIPCYLVNDDRGVIGQTTITAGNYLLHARTDDISYVDYLQVDADDIVIYDNDDNTDFPLCA